ncbi:MAG: CBS domain-containing protein [Candidatus Altiarchaeota archaeon]|nr:CBS domain-containing protein [Candidatus Altiarchaeota archaeon]
MQVKDLMTRDFLVVGEDDGGVEVGDMLEKSRVSSAVVVKRDEVLGVVSKETFFSRFNSFCERRLEELKVKDLMQYDIGFLNETDDLKVAVLKLLESKSSVDRLPVLSSGKLVGMLSKIELTRLFADTMKRKFKVKDLMSFNPVTVNYYSPLADVVNEMVSSGVKRVLVMSGGTLVGMIAIKDISLSLFSEKRMCRTSNPVSVLNAEDIMTRGPVTIKSSADAAEAAKLMLDKKIGGIPVVDSHLEGIITRGCLLKGFQLSWK